MVSLTRVINKPVFTKSYVLTLALIDRSLSLNDDRIPTCWNVRPIWAFGINEPFFLIPNSLEWFLFHSARFFGVLGSRYKLHFLYHSSNKIMLFFYNTECLEILMLSSSFWTNIPGEDWSWNARAWDFFQDGHRRIFRMVFTLYRVHLHRIPVDFQVDFRWHQSTSFMFLEGLVVDKRQTQLPKCRNKSVA